MKKLLFCNTSFQNSFKDVVYYWILVCQNPVILKWRSFEFKAKSEKGLFNLYPK